MKNESAALRRAIKQVKATRTLQDLFRVYERASATVAEHGAPGETRKLWQVYYSHIGNC